MGSFGQPLIITSMVTTAPAPRVRGQVAQSVTSYNGILDFPIEEK